MSIETRLENDELPVFQKLLIPIYIRQILDWQPPTSRLVGMGHPNKVGLESSNTKITAIGTKNRIVILDNEKNNAFSRISTDKKC